MYYVDNSPIECPKCKQKTLFKEWFLESEYVTTHNGYMYKTSRKRVACKCLVCEYCGHTESVDDSFDGPWLEKEEYSKYQQHKKEK